MIPYKIISAVDQPDLLDISDPIVEKEWPEFMLNDPVANKYWANLFELFPAYQFAFIEESTSEIIAMANSIPLRFDLDFNQLSDRGWDWILAKGISDFHNSVEPNIISALSITMNHKYRGKGFSRLVIDEMKNIGISHNLSHLIAPVRPNMKTQHPEIPIEEYIQWKNDDGQPFDAWIRVHCSLGGQIIKVCHQSMYILGKVNDWESWAKIKFPKSGEYNVEGALNHVTIDIENNYGVYIEPNVLIVHTLN